MVTPSRILVVDDNSTNRLVLARSLEKAGYEVTTAKDGYEAVEAATKSLPDLVLMDVMMPGRSGLEACALLKEQEATAAIPVIFVTALSKTERILEAFAAGGCDYITKPFRSEEMLARVAVHVRLRQAEEELRQKNEQMEALTNQLAETNTELAVLSRVDPLTKLFNRRTWEEAAVREHDGFERHGHSYGIIIIDVDHFKAFNDSQGHQAGDDCLTRVAQSIASACRRVDVVGRYGGEEFVVLAPNTSLEGVSKLAERIRQAIWNLGIPHRASPCVPRVTVSLGVADAAGSSWESVLRRADRALYVAKGAGRNMVYVDNGSKPPADHPATEDSSSGLLDPGPVEEGEPAGILVVDDEPTNRAICTGCLERAGYRVHQAADGAEALIRVREDPPEVILMDVAMPGMDGLTCTRKLKGDPDTQGIPIIIVSALESGEEVLAGLEAGADEYLTKPIRTSELILRVRSMAELYRERKDLLHSYQQRGEHLRILARLVEFCRLITGSRQLDEVLQQTLEVVGDVTHTHRISIMLPDSAEERLRIARSRGIDEQVAAAVEVPIGAPIAGQVFASGKPVVINTALEPAPHAAAYDSPFFASVPLVSTPLGTSDRVVGVLNAAERVGHRPFEPHELEYLELIGKLTATAAHAILTRQAHDQASDSITLALAKLAEHRDNDTGMHLERVTRYCSVLAEELGRTARFRDQIDDAFKHHLVRAAPLHDIGKVAIPDEILFHPGRLDDEQMAIMRTHAAIGAQTIQSLIERAPEVGFLLMAADIARYHHERFDGSGYPEGLEADAIPLSARIAALADTYDALTTDRVYQKACPHDRAVAIIAEASGTQFDPAVVEAFLNREQEFAKLAVEFSDEGPPCRREHMPAPASGRLGHGTLNPQT